MGGGSGREPFYSGDGSHDENLIRPYMNLLIQLIAFNGIRKIVDIGCGDFWIMRQVLGFLRERRFECRYLGLDVVENLIEYNRAHFADDNTAFECIDVSRDGVMIPDGDLLIVRQVLQHLSNADIENIMRKTFRFKFILVTEHIIEGNNVIPNLEIPKVGGSTRGDVRSGVYLEYPPYNFKNIVHLLKVYQYGAPIRTSLIIN